MFVTSSCVTRNGWGESGERFSGESVRLCSDLTWILMYLIYLCFSPLPQFCQWRCGRQVCVIRVNDDKLKSSIGKIEVRLLYTVPEGVNHWLKLRKWHKFVCFVSCFWVIAGLQVSASRVRMARIPHKTRLLSPGVWSSLRSFQTYSLRHFVSDWSSN
jgi:hypothetical protein